MITAIVQFALPKPITLEEAARAFESTAPKYQGLRGLVRKYYLRREMAVSQAAYICGKHAPLKPSTTVNGRRE
jgi:hypothetical protein